MSHDEEARVALHSGPDILNCCHRLERTTAVLYSMYASSVEAKRALKSFSFN